MNCIDIAILFIRQSVCKSETVVTVVGDEKFDI